MAKKDTNQLEPISKSSNRKRRKLSVRILTMICLFSIILGTAFGFFGCYIYRINMTDIYKVYAKSMLSLIINNVNADKLRESVQKDEINQETLDIFHYIRHIFTDTKIGNIYMVYYAEPVRDSDLYYLMFADDSPKEPTVENLLQLDAVCKYQDFDDNMLNKFYDAMYNTPKTETIYNSIVNDTENWGYQLTCYTTIKDSNGDVVCIVAIDTSMDRMNASLQRYIYLIVIGDVILLAILLIIMLIFIRNKIVKPINDLAFSAKDFINQMDSVKKSDDLKFKKVLFDTGDEIEILSDGLLAMTEKIKGSMTSLENNIKEKESLLRELYHRTKNNMNVINSYLELQKMYNDDDSIKNILQDTILRIHSISLVHEMLYKAKNLSRINFTEYIKDLFMNIISAYNINKKIHSEVTSDEVTLVIDAAIPLGLVINEILTNIFRHAFIDRGEGSIKITLHEDNEDNVNLTISDDGVGFPKDFDLHKCQSIGIVTILNIVEKQLLGKINYESVKSGGVKYLITFSTNTFSERV